MGEVSFSDSADWTDMISITEVPPVVLSEVIRDLTRAQRAAGQG